MIRRILAAGLLIIAVTLMIWAGVRNGRERKLAQQAEDQNKVIQLRKDGDARPTVGDPTDNAEAKLAGKPAPGFTLVDLDGKKVSLSDFKGKPVMVNFWATWCGPCKLEMPWLEEFSKKYQAQGFVILGVVSDDAPKALVASTVKKLGVTYPILLTDGKVEEPYGGVGELPESFFVDRSGKVLIETAGLMDGQGGKDQVEANIKRIVAAGGA